MNNIRSNAIATIQSRVRGYLTRKTVQQQSKATTTILRSGRKGGGIKERHTPIFSNLPDSTLNQMCSFLDLSTRLSLTRNSKQFSPLEKGVLQTQNLGRKTLQQLAKNDANNWINEQLLIVGQDLVKLIKKIQISEVTIPAALSKHITNDLLINQVINHVNTISNDFDRFIAIEKMSVFLLENRNIDEWKCRSGHRYCSGNS